MTATILREKPAIACRWASPDLNSNATHLVRFNKADWFRRWLFGRVELVVGRPAVKEHPAPKVEVCVSRGGALSGLVRHETQPLMLLFKFSHGARSLA